MSQNVPARSPWTNYDAVAPNFKQEAYARLRKRIAAGEDPKDILRIDDDFYRQKIVDGLVDLSWTLYSRIMGCAEEDNLDEI